MSWKGIIIYYIFLCFIGTSEEGEKSSDGKFGGFDRTPSDSGSGETDKGDIRGAWDANGGREVEADPELSRNDRASMSGRTSGGNEVLVYWQSRGYVKRTCERIVQLGDCKNVNLIVSRILLFSRHVVLAHVSYLGKND